MIQQRRNIGKTPRTKIMKDTLRQPVPEQPRLGQSSLLPPGLKRAWETDKSPGPSPETYHPSVGKSDSAMAGALTVSDGFEISVVSSYAVILRYPS